MAVAYFILCHRSRRTVADLFRYLFNPDDVFLIHADRKAPPDLHAFVAALAGHFDNVHVLPAQFCSWGGFSQAGITLDAMVLALDRLPGWRHFIPLTEQHLPLHPTTAIHAALADGVSWLEAVQVATMYPGAREDVGHRFARRYRELPGVRRLRLRSAGAAAGLDGTPVPWECVPGAGPKRLRGDPAFVRRRGQLGHFPPLAAGG